MKRRFTFSLCFLSLPFFWRKSYIILLLSSFLHTPRFELIIWIQYHTYVYILFWFRFWFDSIFFHLFRYFHFNGLADKDVWAFFPSPISIDTFWVLTQPNAYMTMYVYVRFDVECSTACVCVFIDCYYYGNWTQMGNIGIWRQTHTEHINNSL